MYRNGIWLLAIVGLCFLAMSASTQETKKPKEFTDEQKAAIREERIQSLMAAQQMVADGYKKQAHELLIAGASVFRSLSNFPELNTPRKDAEAKVEITGDGKDDLDKEIKPMTLLEQSDRIFAEASDMAASKSVDDLIKEIKNRKAPNEERPVVGGPKQICRQIGAGQTLSLNFKLVNRTPAHWCYQSSIPLHISVVRDDDNNAWFLGLSMNATRTFHPTYHPKGKVAPITIPIHNPTKRAAKYQFLLQ